MPLSLPPMPSQDIPVLVQTSATYDTDDWGDLARHGINPDAHWWCEVVLRTRRQDAIASLYPPKAGRYHPLFTLELGAEDLYEAETVAHRAIQIGRSLTRLLEDRDDQDAWNALRGQGLPNGYPSILREWMSEVDELGLQWNPLALEGTGRGGDLWTVSMVAKYLGYSGPSANGTARKQLSRWGIDSQGREPGRNGESQYLARQVRAAHEARPGKGRHGASREGGRFISGS